MGKPSSALVTVFPEMFASLPSASAESRAFNRSSLSVGISLHDSVSKYAGYAKYPAYSKYTDGRYQSQSKERAILLLSGLFRNFLMSSLYMSLRRSYTAS